MPVTRRPTRAGKVPIILGAGAVVVLAAVVGSQLMNRPPTSGVPAVQTTAAASTPQSQEATVAPSAPAPATKKPRVLPSAEATSAGKTAPASTDNAEDAGEQALASLVEQAAADGARVAKNSQYMAQLSSKFVGVTDPMLTTATGSHTFMAEDIWAEYQSLKARVWDADVILLDSRTYGKRSSHNGEPIWVVTALSPSFTDEDSVKAWCAALYPGLAGEELTNSCMPNLLRP